MADRKAIGNLHSVTLTIMLTISRNMVGLVAMKRSGGTLCKWNWISVVMYLEVDSICEGANPDCTVEITSSATL